MAQNFNLAPKKKAELTKKFADLCKAPVDDQVEFFLKSFIFVSIFHSELLSVILCYSNRLSEIIGNKLVELQKTFRRHVENPAKKMKI